MNALEKDPTYIKISNLEYKLVTPTKTRQTQFLKSYTNTVS
jgi:hypothetical protein